MATPPPQTPGRTSQTGRLAQPLQLPALTSKDITGLQIFLAVFSLFRASDYLFSTRHNTTIAELAFPLWVWAAACIGIAWALLTGTAAKNHLLVWTGHATGAVTYLGLTLGALLQAIATTPDGPLTTLIPWPWWLLTLALFTTSTIAAAWTATRTGRFTRSSLIACIAAATAATITACAPIIHLDGARAVGPLSTVMLLHIYLAVRMAPPMGAA